MPRVFLWFESNAWSSKISALCANVAVRAVGEIELRVDQSDSKILLATIPALGINNVANWKKKKKALILMTVDVEKTNGRIDIEPKR